MQSQCKQAKVTSKLPDKDGSGTGDLCVVQQTMALGYHRYELPAIANIGSGTSGC